MSRGAAAAPPPAWGAPAEPPARAQPEEPRQPWLGCGTWPRGGSVLQGQLQVVPLGGSRCEELPAGSCRLLGYLFTPACFPEPEQNPIFGGRQ